MIASIDATSAGLAIMSDFDIARLLLSTIQLSTPCREHRSRGIMPGNAAHGTAALRARAAEKHIFVFRFDSPRAGLFYCLRKRKRRRVLENVAMVHPERVLDVDRALAFDAETAIARDSETIFKRLFQPLVHAFEKFLFRLSTHRFIVPREQTPRRIEPEECHGMKTFLAQFRRENAVVGERVTINLARRLVRQSPFRRLIVADIHLLVTFVAVKRPAPRLLRRIFFGL